MDKKKQTNIKNQCPGQNRGNDAQQNKQNKNKPSEQNKK